MSEWETTTEDIEIVLNRHKKSKLIQEAECVIEGESARIEKAVLRYTDLDDQVASAFDEIETILIEEKILKSPKRFAAP